MTVAQLLNKGRELLKEKSIDNFSSEARWLFESVFDCSKEYVFFHADDEVDSEKADEFLKKISQRASGIPVQYIIGSWEFFGESFAVGEGVLIPRPETELLVEFACEYLNSKKDSVVVDLCSGSGCIGLSVAKLNPDARVFLVEKSPDAIRYLNRNAESFNLPNIKIICGDIFNGFDFFGIPNPDLILSNPPYINSDEIEVLQAEVLKEPVMALDGGDDGLMFYRAIAEKWLPYCGGAIAVECGEGQSDSIKLLFSKQCSETCSIKDFNDIERAVIGRKDKK